MEFSKEVITTLKIFINHNFVKYPNSMVWKIDVYVKITITYFYKPKAQ